LLTKVIIFIFIAVNFCMANRINEGGVFRLKTGNFAYFCCKLLKVMDFVYNARWTEHLTPDQRQVVLDKSMLVDFAQGETIIKQGIAASHILYLEEGMAKLSVVENDRSTTFKIVAPESFIGLMCSFVKRSFDFNAVAIKACRVRMIDRDVFEDLIKENGAFAVQTVQLMSLATNKIVRDLIHLSHKQADGALCTILMELAGIFGSDSYQLPFTRVELADTIGYSKESVIHTLSSLQRDGVIRISGKQVDILDKRRLETIARHG
jgi:CRP-like cAMP-binding protein